MEYIRGEAEIAFIRPRPQGHQEKETLLSTPQAEHLFENLVIAETIKTKDHFNKNWELYFWRTKEKEEIDLIIETDICVSLFEIKLASFGIGEIPLPAALVAKNKKTRRAFVTAVGQRETQSNGIDTVPLKDFCEYLLEG